MLLSGGARAARAFAALLLISASLLAPALARAAVIPPGREAAVVALVRPQLKQHGFADDASISIEPTVIRVQLSGAGMPANAALVIGDGRDELPGDARDLGRGVGVRCAACSDAQLRELEPLVRSIARARAGVRDDIWAPEGVSRADLVNMPEASPAARAAAAEYVAGYRRDDPHEPNPIRAALVALAMLAAGLVSVGSVLAGERRRDLALLAAITAVGAVPRLLVEHQLMSVNSYARDLPWLWHLRRNGIPMGALVPDGLSSLEQVGVFNVAFALVMPIVAYAHARTLFDRDARVAQLAALVIAVCPMVIGFSASETLFVSSMVFGSLTLLCADRALTAARSRAVFAWLLAGTGLFWLAADSRPLNAALALVVAVAAVVRADSSRWRRLVVPLAYVALAAVIARHAMLTGSVSDAPGVNSDPPTLATFGEVARTLPSIVAENNYFRPTILPAWISALAVWGVVRLWQCERSVLAHLLAWFGVVFGAHTLVSAHTPVIAARYGLHSLLPVVFLAAFGLHDLLRRIAELPPAKRKHRVAAGAAAAALAAGTTLPTVWLVRPLEDDANQEYRFVRELWTGGLPEPGAIVVEHYDDNEAPRYLPVGTRVRGSHARTVVEPFRRVVNRDVPVYYYEGLPCLWHRRADEPVSPRCLETRAAKNWEVVASRRIDGQSHDHKPMSAAGGRVTLYRLK